MPYTRLHRLCIIAWNSPNTLLGFVGATGGKLQWHPGTHIWECIGGWLVTLMRRRRWADAITLGDVVLYADSTLPPRLRAHEAVHVAQARLWGPLFLPAYCMEALWQWLRTGDGYHSNRFEQAAYKKG